MSEYLVEDTDLTAVANAIRTKGGTSTGLAFPLGFISAIGNITSGDWVDISTNVIMDVQGNSSLIFAIYSLSLNIVAIYVHLDIPDPYEPGALTVAYGQYQPPERTTCAVAFSINSSATPVLLAAYNEPGGLCFELRRIPYDSGCTDLVMVYTPVSS